MRLIKQTTLSMFLIRFFPLICFDRSSIIDQDFARLSQLQAASQEMEPAPQLVMSVPLFSNLIASKDFSMDKPLFHDIAEKEGFLLPPVPPPVPPLQEKNSNVNTPSDTTAPKNADSLSSRPLLLAAAESPTASYDARRQISTTDDDDENITPQQQQKLESSSSSPLKELPIKDEKLPPVDPTAVDISKLDSQLDEETPDAMCTDSENQQKQEETPQVQATSDETETENITKPRETVTNDDHEPVSDLVKDEKEELVVTSDSEDVLCVENPDGISDAETNPKQGDEQSSMKVKSEKEAVSKQAEIRSEKTFAASNNLVASESSEVVPSCEDASTLSTAVEDKKELESKADKLSSGDSVDLLMDDSAVAFVASEEVCSTSEAVVEAEVKSDLAANVEDIETSVVDMNELDINTESMEYFDAKNDDKTLVELSVGNEVSITSADDEFESKPPSDQLEHLSIPKCNNDSASGYDTPPEEFVPDKKNKFHQDVPHVVTQHEEVVASSQEPASEEDVHIPKEKQRGNVPPGNPVDTGKLHKSKSSKNKGEKSEKVKLSSKHSTNPYLSKHGKESGKKEKHKHKEGSSSSSKSSKDPESFKSGEKSKKDKKLAKKSSFKSEKEEPSRKYSSNPYSNLVASEKNQSQKSSSKQKEIKSPGLKKVSKSSALDKDSSFEKSEKSSASKHIYTSSSEDDFPPSKPKKSVESKPMKPTKSEFSERISEKKSSKHHAIDGKEKKSKSTKLTSFSSQNKPSKTPLKKSKSDLSQQVESKSSKKAKRASETSRKPHSAKPDPSSSSRSEFSFDRPSDSQSSSKHHRGEPHHLSEPVKKKRKLVEVEPPPAKVALNLTSDSDSDAFNEFCGNQKRGTGRKSLSEMSYSEEDNKEEPGQVVRSTKKKTKDKKKVKKGHFKADHRKSFFDSDSSSSESDAKLSPLIKPTKKTKASKKPVQNPRSIYTDTSESDTDVSSSTKPVSIKSKRQSSEKGSTKESKSSLKTEQPVSSSSHSLKKGNEKFTEGRQRKASSDHSRSEKKKDKSSHKSKKVPLPTTVEQKVEEDRSSPVREQPPSASWSEKPDVDDSSNDDNASHKSSISFGLCELPMSTDLTKPTKQESSAFHDHSDTSDDDTSVTTHKKQEKTSINKTTPPASKADTDSSSHKTDKVRSGKSKKSKLKKKKHHSSSLSISDSSGLKVPAPRMGSSASPSSFDSMDYASSPKPSYLTTKTIKDETVYPPEYHLNRLPSLSAKKLKKSTSKSSEKSSSSFKATKHESRYNSSSGSEADDPRHQVMSKWPNKDEPRHIKEEVSMQTGRAEGKSSSKQLMSKQRHDKEERHHHKEETKLYTDRLDDKGSLTKSPSTTVPCLKKAKAISSESYKPVKRPLPGIEVSAPSDSFQKHAKHHKSPVLSSSTSKHHKEHGKDRMPSAKTTKEHHSSKETAHTGSAPDKHHKEYHPSPQPATDRLSSSSSRLHREDASVLKDRTTPSSSAKSQKDYLTAQSSNELSLHKDKEKVRHPSGHKKAKRDKELFKGTSEKREKHSSKSSHAASHLSVKTETQPDKLKSHVKKDLLKSPKKSSVSHQYPEEKPMKPEFTYRGPSSDKSSAQQQSHKKVSKSMSSGFPDELKQKTHPKPSYDETAVRPKDSSSHKPIIKEKEDPASMPGSMFFRDVETPSTHTVKESSSGPSNKPYGNKPTSLSVVDEQKEKKTTTSLPDSISADAGKVDRKSTPAPPKVAPEPLPEKKPAPEKKLSPYEAYQLQEKNKRMERERLEKLSQERDEEAVRSIMGFSQEDDFLSFGMPDLSSEPVKLPDPKPPSPPPVALDPEPKKKKEPVVMEPKEKVEPPTEGEDDNKSPDLEPRSTAEEQELAAAISAIDCDTFGYTPLPTFEPEPPAAVRPSFQVDKLPAKEVNKPSSPPPPEKKSPPSKASFDGTSVAVPSLFGDKKDTEGESAVSGLLGTSAPCITSISSDIPSVFSVDKPKQKSPKPKDSFRVKETKDSIGETTSVEKKSLKVTDPVKNNPSNSVSDQKQVVDVEETTENTPVSVDEEGDAIILPSIIAPPAVSSVESSSQTTSTTVSTTASSSPAITQFLGNFPQQQPTPKKDEIPPHQQQHHPFAPYIEVSCNYMLKYICLASLSVGYPQQKKTPRSAAAMGWAILN